MINKEQLMSINDLKLTGFVDVMDDEQFADYCITLDLFIESFPLYESNMKTAFEAKDYTAFSEALLHLRKLLRDIHAAALEQDCDKMLANIQTMRHEKNEAFLTYLLTASSMLSIDIQMAQYKEGDTSAAANSPASANSGPRSILAVDDVTLFLNLMRSVLQNTGYKFVGVTSGAEALRYLKDHTPDLLILDIEMPEMNGYQLAENIRSLGINAPIIYLTGNATREYVLKAIKAGAADFIVKPINKEHVLDIINKHIG